MGRTESRWSEMADHLREKGLLEPAQAEGIAQWLGQRQQTASPLMTVQVFSALGGWLSSICLIVFLGSSGLINFDHFSSLLVWGGLFLAAAVILNRKGRGLFVGQLALSLGIAGFTLMMTGIGIGQNSLAIVALSSAALTLLLYPLYRDEVYRFLSITVTLVLAVTWLVFDLKAPSYLHILVAVEAGALYWLLRRSSGRWRLPPVLYSLTVCLPLTLTLGLYPDDYVSLPGFSWWPSQILLTLWLAALVLAVARDHGMERRITTRLLAGVALLGCISTPGILVSLGLLVLGRHRHDRWMGFWGLIAFALFIFFFYYALAMPLNHKSFLLMGSGALLLVSRVLFKRLGFLIGGVS